MIEFFRISRIIVNQMKSYTLFLFHIDIQFFFQTNHILNFFFSRDFKNIIESDQI